jgi:hypothetical protein
LGNVPIKRKYNDYHCHEWNWCRYTAVGRKFTELQGWMNQYIAATADTVSAYGFWYSCNYKRKKMK